MASTMYLRPTSDSSLSHACSSGSIGYLMINEETSDEDSTYIYQNISSTSSSSVSSTFLFGGSVSKNDTVTSVTMYVSGRKTSSNGTATIKATLNVDGTSSGNTISFSPSTSYAEQSVSNDDVITQINNYIKSNGTLPTVSVTINTTGNKNASKNSSFNIRITQVYLKLEITSSGGLTIKQGETWVSVNKVYQKVNGIWVEQTDFTSVFDLNKNYVYNRKPVLYSAKNISFNGTNYVDSGVKLFESEASFTIFLEVTNGALSNEVDSHTVLHCMHEESPWYGSVIQCSVNQAYDNEIHMPNNENVKIYGSNDLMAGTSAEGLTTRFVQRYNKESKTVDVYSLKADGTINQATGAYTGSFSALTESLILGCYQDASGSKGRFWLGTINTITVYGTALSDDEVNAFLTS